MTKRSVTRRRFMQGSAGVAAAAAFTSMPFVRGAHAAGKLTMGFWDHWVPGANDTLTKIVNDWGAKEKIEVQCDYITSQGNKNLLTIAAEGQAKAGHDILAMPTWWPVDNAKRLEPMDDVMAELIKLNGKVNGTVEYLGRHGGSWYAVPATCGSQIKGPCTRLDLMKKYAGIDIQAMYPAGSAPKADAWNMDTFIKAAEACHKGGNPFGIGLGQTSDSVDTAGAIFQSFGATLVDAKGTITVNSNEVKQVLDYYKKLAGFLPPDVPAWDDSSNNKWLVSGKGSLIMNPPSAWAVAKRDAPQVAEQCWTHGMPAGPKGRFSPFLPYFLTSWNFGKNKTAAKALIVHLSQPDNVAKLVEASGGYDLPAFEKLTTLKTWAEAGPPKGTLYHYPNPHNHQILSIAASPAPPKIAAQIYSQAIMTKMVVRHNQGESMDKTIAWASSELEGFTRT